MDNLMRLVKEQDEISLVAYTVLVKMPIRDLTLNASMAWISVGQVLI